MQLDGMYAVYYLGHATVLRGMGARIVVEILDTGVA